MLARGGAVGLFELLEDALEVLFKEARAAVADGEDETRDRRVAGVADAHGNASAVGELDGIAEQVEHHLAQSAGVGLDDLGNVGGDDAAEPDPVDAITGLGFDAAAEVDQQIAAISASTDSLMATDSESYEPDAAEPPDFVDAASTPDDGYDTMA